MKPSAKGFPGLALGLLIASVVIAAALVAFQPALDRSKVISAEATAGVAFLAGIGAFIASMLSLGTRSGKVLAVASGSVVLLFLVWWLSESGGPRRRLPVEPSPSRTTFRSTLRTSPQMSERS